MLNRNSQFGSGFLLSPPAATPDLAVGEGQTDLAIDPGCGASTGDDSAHTSSMPSAADPSFGTELCGLLLTYCTEFSSSPFDEQFSAYVHVLILTLFLRMPPWRLLWLLRLLSMIWLK